MTTIDIYARVSRASDKRDRSTAGQVTECKALVLDKGYTIGEVHIDSSKSAWNRKVFRPGWEALMMRLEAGAVDGVIIFELSRFTRRSREGLRLVDVAESGLLVMDTENDYDLTKGRDRKTFRDAISAAEFESDMISMRSKRGKRAKVRDNGEFNVAQRPFGFEHDSVTPREDEAAELRAAAKKLLKGVSASAICADLNERGVATTFGNIWKPPSLRRVLLRPSNVGDVSYRGEVLHPGRYPGILDRDVYDQIVADYAGRHRGRPVSNIATGFVLCAKCKRTLNAKTMYVAHRNPDGSAVKVYICVKGLGGCDQIIDWYDLNSYVKATALAILCDPARAQEIEQQAAAASGVHAELSVVTAKIAELEDIANTVAARWGSGQISQARHDATVKPLDEQLVKLHARKATLIASVPARAAAEKVESRATWERRWKGTDVTGQREIVRTAFAGRTLLVSPGARYDPARDRCSFGVEAGSKDRRVSNRSV